MMNCHDLQIVAMENGSPRLKPKPKLELSRRSRRGDMPYTKVMIHLIWSTKNRQPIITAEIRPLLIQHIRENSRQKGIFINAINCVKDHIHILVSLGTEQTIAKTVMLIKGESSFWVNKQGLMKHKFEWQDEYIALSVSQSGVENVRMYIANQAEHHRKTLFSEEYEEFIKAYGFEVK